jgi:ParB family chromosome partitioning protein
MSDKKPDRRGLGRGLSALMADVGADMTGRPDQASAPPRRPDHVVPIERIAPNPNQPRRDFPAEALQELAASLKEKGVIQPLIVRDHPTISNHYEIVAGERRWRAAQIAQLHELPVVVRQVTDSELLELAIIENIQRADLNPVEEALGYKALMDRFGHTQEKLAEALSKSRSHIANLLRLLNLPDQVLAWLREGRLTAGHARTLVTADDPAGLARQIMDQGLSVREAERLTQKAPGKRRVSSSQNRSEKDADTRILEQDLSSALGLPVLVDHQGHDGGRVTITYRTLQQLDDICQLLSQNR